MLLAGLFVFFLATAPTVSRPTKSVLSIVPGMIVSSAAPVLSFCECGYFLAMSSGSSISAGSAAAVSTSFDLSTGPVVSVDSVDSVVSPGSLVSGSIDNRFVFMDVIESDFFHLLDVHADTDWFIQNYNVSASAARGPYGMNFTNFNVVSNPIANSSNWSGPPVSSGDPGVQLSVGAGVPQNGFVQVAQMNSVREDLLFGTYRALLKMASGPGTCTSFFWYYNDSQEIDFEALSSQYDFQNKTYPLNLVLQSQQSARQGFSSTASGDWKVINLPFDPTDGFHEYRIDFVPGNVIYYGDGQVLAVINTTAVPTSPGHLILSQWSNGDHGWSAGPPLQRAVSTVGYVKGYFNSSDPARQSAAAKRCKDPSAPGAVCAISDQLLSPGSYFSDFFSNHPNMTNNQTIYGKSESPPKPNPFEDAIGSLWLLVNLMLFLSLMAMLI